MNNAAAIALELTSSLYQDVLEEFGTTRANEMSDTIHWRTVDFQMHEPSKDNIHPSYDT